MKKNDDKMQSNNMIAGNIQPDNADFGDIQSDILVTENMQSNNPNLDDIQIDHMQSDKMATDDPAQDNTQSDNASSDDMLSVAIDKPKSAKIRKNQKTVSRTRLVAFTALMTALVYVMSLLGFSSPAFYFNLGDSAILITAFILGPIPAMIAGGIGAFFADLTLFPATMLFTLVIKGLEGLIAGTLVWLIFHFVSNAKLKVGLVVISFAIASFFMMTGYFVAQTFFYGTKSAALIALPMDAIQATLSLLLSSILLFVCKLARLKDKVLG